MRDNRGLVGPVERQTTQNIVSEASQFISHYFPQLTTTNNVGPRFGQKDIPRLRGTLQAVPTPKLPAKVESVATALDGPERNATQWSSYEKQLYPL